MNIGGLDDAATSNGVVRVRSAWAGSLAYASGGHGFGPRLADPGPDLPDWDLPEVAPPDWVFVAAAENLRADLADAASGRPRARHAIALERACPPLPGQHPAPARHNPDTAGHGPGGDTGGDTGGLSAPELLHGIVGLSRLIGWAQAVQQQYIAVLAQPGVIAPVADLIDLAACSLGIARDVPDLPEQALLADPRWASAIKDAAVKVASAEIGCALALSPVTARKRTEQAVYLTRHLPAVHAAQLAGEIDGYRASIITDRTAVLPPELRAQAADAVLPAAATRAPARLTALIDREVIRLDPGAAARRGREARTTRGTWVTPGQDDMATFTANLAAPDAAIANSVLDRIATAITAAGLAAGRGQSQLRADAFTALFHDLAHTGRITSGDNMAGGDMSGISGTNTGASSSGFASSTGARTVNAATDTRAGVHSSPATGDTADTADTATRTRVTAPDPTAADPPEADPIAPDQSTTVGRRAARLPICVNVYVSAATLAGWDENPAEIDGHGIITADLARELAKSATAVRAITTGPVPHMKPPPGGTPAPAGRKPPPDTGRMPVPGHSTNAVRTAPCGTILDVGRIRYRPPQRTVDHVTTCDRICAFPHCNTRAARCDIDHRQPFDNSVDNSPANSLTNSAANNPANGPAKAPAGTAGGVTCPCNLDALCRFHHMIKTFTGWNSQPAVDGTLTWTSPTGNHYPTESGHILTDPATNPLTALPTSTTRAVAQPTDTPRAAAPYAITPAPRTMTPTTTPPAAAPDMRSGADPPPF